MKMPPFESEWKNYVTNGLRDDWTIKGGFKPEDTGKNLRLQHKYSKSLSWAENLNFPPKTVNNLFKFSAQDSDLEYLCWRCKKSPVSSDLKPPLPLCCTSGRYMLSFQERGFFTESITHLANLRFQSWWVSTIPLLLNIDTSLLIFFGFLVNLMDYQPKIASQAKK